MTSAVPLCRLFVGPTHRWVFCQGRGENLVDSAGREETEVGPEGTLVVPGLVLSLESQFESPRPRVCRRVHRPGLEEVARSKRTGRHSQKGCPRSRCSQRSRRPSMETTLELLAATEARMPADTRWCLLWYSTLVNNSKETVAAVKKKPSHMHFASSRGRRTTSSSWKSWTTQVRSRTASNLLGKTPQHWRWRRHLWARTAAAPPLPQRRHRQPLLRGPAIARGADQPLSRAAARLRHRQRRCQFSRVS